MDFFTFGSENAERGKKKYCYPVFQNSPSEDLMVKGGSYYAIWNEEKGLWSTSKFEAVRLIDKETARMMKEHDSDSAVVCVQKKLRDDNSGMVKKFDEWIRRREDQFANLNANITFRNTPVNKNDYATFTLDYEMTDGECPAYDEIMSTLYSPEEREKLEWAVGAIITGDAKKIQKFIVLHGDPGTGKSTVLDIITNLFTKDKKHTYVGMFNAKELGSGTNAFATSVFANNYPVLIQHDGDLSRIKDNTIINTVVAHETITVNQKFKNTFEIDPISFLFMGTNSDVNISDSRSGLIRRLIVVEPTGNKIHPAHYKKLMNQVDFEYGQIAYRCVQEYKRMGKHYYDNYRPLDMMSNTNPVYAFVEEHYFDFLHENGISLKRAYDLYKEYCEDSGEQYPLKKSAFKSELKVYFEDFTVDARLDDDSRTHIRNYFVGFKPDLFKVGKVTKKEEVETVEEEETSWLSMTSEVSLLDKLYSDCPAQLASKKETPLDKWEFVTTTLKDIDTKKVHYLKPPNESHIFIDFDLKDDDGNKSAQRNLEAASKWPPTYAEFSKGGEGVHLHYIYDGDPNDLSRVFDDNIEIKVMTGNSSLRRRLSKCNEIPIAHISSGLPLKEKGDKMINFEATKTENGLRAIIKKNLRKEVHPGTKPSVDFIFKILEDAYNSDLKYDVSDMRPAVIAFATNSTHQAEYCLKLVNKMHFKSEEMPEAGKEGEDKPIIFYDIEVFPNLLLVNWKLAGSNNPVNRMINPSPSEIEELQRKYRWVGFNCRRYDNHIMFARYMGYTIEQCYKLSQKIVNNCKDCFFGEAYNWSYTDVYDYTAKKQSLKKWEIELGIHHQELGLPWDKPVPEHLWTKVAEYCDNDVIATEAVWDATQGDFIARQILADVAGMTVNDTTNTLTTRIIFGNERKPQSEFNYRFMGEPEVGQEVTSDDGITFFQENGKPVFPGYKFENGTSTYLGEDVGEGGYVYANPGMYSNVVTFDVASMHPSSVIAENLFGDRYTQRFNEILQTRIHIKHKEFDKAKKLLNGALDKYLSDEKLAKALAQALKIAINSVYGLTAAKFDNAMRDPRNIDNIVAKRGALFMINLKHLVEDKGYTVVHIKTDSIKIADPTPEIIDFVTEYGKKFGYNFEVEHKFEKICLVNDAVYIAKLAEDDPDEPGQWTATGKQFAVPYVFKTLFSHEKIEFDDLCETMSVTGDLYLDMNEDLPDISIWENLKEFRRKYPDWTLVGQEATKKANSLLTEYSNMTDSELDTKLSEGHDYQFVGKVGQFCPIKAGKNGGILYRYTSKDNKYSAATGSKGYRWLESEYVKEHNKIEDIDKSYYQNMVDKAVETISQYGDFEWFVA